MDVLVVGANGQLGSACCRALLEQGHQVRGSVRQMSRAVGLDGIQLVQADLTRGLDLDGLLAGVEVVVLTANTAAPRAGDDITRFADGMARLVEAAGRAGVQRVVLPSFPVTDIDAQVPFSAERRRLEEQVRAVVPGSVVLRLGPFMEVWLALVGSSIPLRGEPSATVGRPSPFLGTFRRATGTTVERHGLMLVPGPTSHRQAFIAVPDVAAACAAAVTRDDAAGATFEVGGPEVLTWLDVAQVYSRVLGRRVRAVSTPAGVFGAAAAVLRPFAPVPSRTMALNRFLGVSETDWPVPAGGLLDPATMTTVETFLARKAALPADLPQVA